MLVDKELRERLSVYCLVTKRTQEEAGNVAIRELLERVDGDPTMKARMDRASELRRMMDAL